MARTCQDRGFSFVLRPHDEVLRFASGNGLELVEPGLVPVHHWRPDHSPDTGASTADMDPAFIDGLDDIDKIHYNDINDVTDADINVYGMWPASPERP